MSSIIRIKRSETAAQPASLANGELAFTSNGDILFIGSAGVVTPIAGKRYPGTLTANQAIVTNTSNWINATQTAKLIVGATNETVNVTSITNDGTLASVSNNSLVTSWAVKNYVDSVSGSSTLGGLSDVTLTSTTNNDILVYDAASGQWENHTIGGTANQVSVTFTGQDITVGLTSNVSISDKFTANTVAVTGTTSSSNTTTGALTVAGGLGVAGRGNMGELAVGNTSQYTSVNGSVVSTIDVLASGTVNASTLSIGAWVVANNSGVFTSGVVNADIVQVGTSFKANTTAVVIANTVGLYANGTVGTDGQVLTSNGSTVFWKTLTADITEVTAGDGLTGGGTSGALTIDVGAGDGIAVNATAVSVKANNGIVSNTDGVFVAAGTGVTVNSTGVHIGQPVATTDNVTFNDVAINGNTVLGSNSSDVISFKGYVNTAILPAANVTYDLGSSTMRWKDLYLSGSSLVLGNSTLSDTVDGLTANNFKVDALLKTQDVQASGNVVIGSNGSDVLSIVAGVNTSILPSANVTYDLGNNFMRWNEVHAANVHSVSGYFDGNVQISGDLIVSGNVTTTNVNSVVISDPMIYLAGNNYTNDLLDIGFVANYNDGTNRHTGLFRDATDGVYKLFNNLTQELSGNNTVDIADGTFRIATLQSYLYSGGLSTNSGSVAVTANSTVNVNIVANTLTLSTALAATDGGTGFDTYTSGDLLVANTGNALSKLGIGSNGQILQVVGNQVVYGDLDGGTF